MEQNKDSILTSVHRTTNYAQFAELPGNREKSERHIAELIVSFKRDGHLISPIIVSTRLDLRPPFRYVIIDGQHRFEAARRLNLPIYYIVLPNYGLKEVQILNAKGIVWKRRDYLHSFCMMAKPEYLKMRQFMNDYPGFKWAAYEYILRYASNKETQSKREDFEKGAFTIPDYNASVTAVRNIIQIGQYYEGFQRSVFVRAILKVLKHDNYDHLHFIAKLKAQPGKMRDCLNVQDYRELIEKIYNHRRRGGRVNLRF